MHLQPSSGVFILLCLLITSFSVAKSSNPDSLASDSTAFLQDTATAGSDIDQRAIIISENAVESKVIYSATDSIHFDVAAQKVYLFGKAKVKYQHITLEAGYIDFDMKNSVVFAKGADSAGVESGKPVFKDAEQEFSARTITYNFKTKKGLITKVVTQEGEGFMHSETAKKDEKNVLFIKNGSYTTCEHEHPHFAIKSTRIKVIPDNKIITGPAYLSIMDVPTPLVVPFGIFPNKKGRASGILIPAYGESNAQGFFLRDGGYYFGLNDNIDMAIRGDIYSKGSWGIRTMSDYKKRYRYNGRLNLKYSSFVFGTHKDLPGFTKSNDFFIDWQHQQDPKARPNTRFAANVRAGSSTYNTYNSYQPNDYLSNTFTSNISFHKSWAGKPYNLSVNMTHSQNTLNKTVDMSLPDVVFTVNRRYPFKKKKAAGEQKWYEKINFGYTANMKNTLSTYDSLLFDPSSLSRMRNGMRHTVPMGTSFKVLKYFSFTPSMNYNERWYLETIRKRYDTSGILIIDTVHDFNTTRDVNFNASLSTRLYGMLQFNNFKVMAVRHVLTPTVGFSYRPDFGTDKWGYYKTIENDASKTRYSIFEQGIFGSPPSGKSGSVNFSLANNLEMKVRSKKDTVSHTKKIMLIENLEVSSSYNMAADSLKWSKFLLSGRTKLFKNLDIRYDAVFDPYILVADSLGNKKNINISELKQNGRLFRITNADWSFGLNLNLGNESLKKLKKTSAKGTEEELEMINNKPDAYVDFTLPWMLNIGYSLRHTKLYNYSFYAKPDSISKSIIQTLNFNGELKLTEKWRIGFSSGYDFINKQVSYTSVDIYRDLHCWEMKFNWIPFGFRKSYNISISVKSSVLQDLKLQRKRDWYDY